mmetsp:Transcript_60762/g.169872  ORF Transcript_60762/g.169872 Transcript_60762/m.169872 type:complete len:222 (-) Transcript_60762:1378-2043(-)
MELLQSSRWRGGSPAANVAHHDVLVQPLPQARDEAWPHVCPSAHVLGLLLHPSDVSRVHAVAGIHIAVELQLLLHQVEREGRDLLKRHNRNVLGVELLPLHRKLVVELPGAENEAIHLGGIDGRVPLADQPLESSAGGHVRQRAHALPKPEEVLRRRDHQRLSEVAVELSPERVEVVGGGRDVDGHPVRLLALDGGKVRSAVRNVVFVVIRHLEEPLEAAR